ncbi:MAG: hypothetical protein JEZ06_10975 [Anaerolineaceae bacterium]|nr:hypothetical protein [Anaerolineaceae bacterium]
MRKIVPVLILFTMIFSGCGGFSSADPTLSDMEMQTRVAQILTEEMPGEEIPAVTLIPTDLPVVEPSVQIAEPDVITPTATSIPSLTPTEVQPTPTITLTPTILPTETNTPPPGDPKERLGNPISTDPMNEETFWGWPTDPFDYTTIKFENGFLQLTGVETGIAGWRLPIASAATDIYIEMSVNTGECSTNDNYGIIFRIPVFLEADRGYLYAISCDGTYRLKSWDGKEGENGQSLVLDWGKSEYINIGPNQTNRIGVMTLGNEIYLYANGYRLNSSPIRDSTFPGGHFGIFVTSKDTEKYTIWIDEMSFWLNPTGP